MMSKQLDCIVDGCDATIEGESKEEIVGKVTEHAQGEHPDVELDDETVANIRSRIDVA